MPKDLKMQSDEVLELHNLADAVYERDHLVGRALHALVHHLAHAHGLDVADEQDKANKKAEDDAKAREKALQEQEAKLEAERAQAEQVPTQEGKK